MFPVLSLLAGVAGTEYAIVGASAAGGRRKGIRHRLEDKRSARHVEDRAQRFLELLDVNHSPVRTRERLEPHVGAPAVPHLFYFSAFLFCTHPAIGAECISNTGCENATLSLGYPTRGHFVMRIGTYNVFGLKGFPPEEAAKELGDTDSEKTAAHFQKVFEELSCDILALQEGVSIHQIQRIVLSMGLNVATFPSPIHWPGHLLTRFPILESRVFSHTEPESGERPFSRMAGAALLEIDEKTRMWVFVVHLHPGIVELRDREAEIVRSKVAELSSITEHIMVLGDFNCEVDERIHGHLKKMGFSKNFPKSSTGVYSSYEYTSSDKPGKM